MQCFEPTLYRALAHDPQCTDGVRQTSRLDYPELPVFEQVSDQPACTFGDYDRVRLGQSLQTSG
jgi:hypothetical protein